MKKLQQILIILTAFAVMAVAAYNRNGKVWGHDFNTADTATKAAAADTMRTLADGTIVVNTTGLAKDVSGFGGPVPLEIYIRNGKVSKVVALKNSETPDFFSHASSLLTRWNGKSIDEAAKMKVDGVSGATFSSRGIIGNMQRGLQYAAKNAKEPSTLDAMDHSAKGIAALIVVLLAAIVPLFYRNRRWRTVQLVLNIGILGLWCGTFLSWATFLNFAANGIDVLAALVPVVMLITAFVYPLFGKRQFYCTHVCPFGSLQELAGRTNSRKWKMSPTLIRRLNFFRELLFAVLMVLMATGVFAEWADYELFTAFAFQSASIVVIVLAVVFVVLSVFVPRPYCRFVCPTGALFKLF